VELESLRCSVAEKSETKAAVGEDSQVLAAIFGSMSAHAVTIGRDGRLESASPSWLKFARERGEEPDRTGRGVDYLAICRHAAQQGYPPAQKALEGIEAVLSGRLPRASLEYSCPESFGKQRWFLMSIDPMPPEHGGAVIGHIDITDRVEAEAALREALAEGLRATEERYRVLYEENPTMYFTVDEQGIVISVNKFGAEQLGYTVKDLIGQSVLKVFHEDDREAVRQQLRRCLDHPRQLFCWELRKIREDGNLMWVREAARAVQGGNGRPVVLIVCEDVGELKQAEAALRQAYEEMEGRVRERTRLLSNTVQTLEHEIAERNRAEEALKEALAEVQRLKERLEAENVYLRSEVSGAHGHRQLVGRSEAIQKVLQQVEQVARTDMTVLVLGETGTGKELVARAVHEKSGRRERPLVKVNCSALPGELIESELFGHEKGAFTGAIARQMGRFELADGATIFLDEVGDMSLRLQAKLLRVLQEGEFERLGSGKTIKVNVRVIAATNRSLAEAIQKGRFRLDLYYRLNVYPIHLSPLRERGDDIDLLAETFLSEASRRLGRLFDPIPKNVLDVFRRYDWPGNVRELQNVIERAVVTSVAPVLQLPEGWELPLSAGPRSGKPTTAAEAPMPATMGTAQESTLEQFQRTHILEVLNQTGWRIEGPRGAAIFLGLNPSTLRSRMQRLGIQKPRQTITDTPR